MRKTKSCMQAGREVEVARKAMLAAKVPRFQQTKIQKRHIMKMVEGGGEDVWTFVHVGSQRQSQPLHRRCMEDHWC